MSNISKQILDRLIKEFQNDSCQDRVKADVLDPCVNYMGKRLAPYIFTMAITLCIMLLTVIYLMFLIHRLHLLQKSQ